MIVRWPGVAAERVTAGQPIITMGFLPTTLSAAGVRALRGRELDVVDLVPFLSGCQAPFSRTLLWRSKRDKAIRKVVRDGDKKLLSEDGREKPRGLSIDGREENGFLPQAEPVPPKLRTMLRSWGREVAAPRPRDFRRAESKH